MKGWGLRGKAVRRETPRKRERTSIFGAMTLHGRCYYRTEPKGNGKAFIRFIKQLLRQFPRRHIALVVDNSSIHKCKAVKKFLRKNSRVTLHCLPSYSPEYNPIERFWQWLKRQLNGAATIQTLKELKRSLQTLILRFNERWHDAAIQFDFGVWSKLKTWGK